VVEDLGWAHECNGVPEHMLVESLVMDTLGRIEVCAC
jgi:hypothetical protein